jgi:amidohydrolase
MTTLLERAASLEAELIELRRELHRHPELSFRETRTAARAAELSRAAGLEVRTGVGRTGVVAELKNGAGPVVALRADMDALPIQEANDVPYRSTVAGVMHACGHDAHVSMLIGAARLLADARARGEMPSGTVRLLFQPSEEASDEENLSGAARMIEDGAMTGVDAVFGTHIWAHLPAGRVYLRPGPIMAGSDRVRMVITGHAAHAGRPHEGVDAIVLAAHVVLAVQNAVARRIAPWREGVVSLGMISGGVAENVLADRVELHGTIRYFDLDVLDRLRQELRRAAAVAEALGGGCDVTFTSSYPPVVNDEGATAIARAAVRDALGQDAETDFDPMMGAEDFSLLQQQAPGSFLWLGAALEPPREHHHANFDIDERVLGHGAATLAACALRALRELA